MFADRGAPRAREQSGSVGSQAGFLGSRRYEVVGDPDRLVEIADWESAEARAVHLREAAATGIFAPLADLLAAPFRATVLSRLP